MSRPEVGYVPDMLLFPAALADPPSAGLLLPGASDTGGAHGGASASAGGAVIAAGGINGAFGASAHGWYATTPGEALVLSGSVVAIQRTVDGARSLYALAGVRYEVLHQERAALAPWVGVLAQPVGDLLPYRTIAAAGLAGEIGWGRARVDFSVPLVLVPVEDPGAFYSDEAGLNDGVAAALAVADLGIRWQLGPNDELRIGKAVIVPELGWKHDVGPVYTELGIAGWLVVNHARLTVGFSL